VQISCKIATLFLADVATCSWFVAVVTVVTARFVILTVLITVLSLITVLIPVTVLILVTIVLTVRKVGLGHV
jgi:hypothetical protein